MGLPWVGRWLWDVGELSIPGTITHLRWVLRAVEPVLKKGWPVFEYKKAPPANAGGAYLFYGLVGVLWQDKLMRTASGVLPQHDKIPSLDASQS